MPDKKPCRPPGVCCRAGFLLLPAKGGNADEKTAAKITICRGWPLRIRKILEWGCACGLLLTIVLTAAAVRYQTVCARVCGDTLRLHILANSDTVEDQLLKLQVRDAVLEQVTAATQYAETKQQAVQTLRTAMPDLQRTAQRTLRHAGSSQQVQCRLEEIPFAARRYSGFWLPAGTYTALRIELSAPRGTTGSVCCTRRLCVGSSEARYADTEENALVFGGYQVRFALLDTACSVWQKITD